MTVKVRNRNRSAYQSTTVADYSLDGDVLWLERPDGTSRLVHMGGSVCALDNDSTGLLRAILSDGLGAALTFLRNCHTISEPQARSDLQAFVAALVAERMIKHSGQRRSPLRTLRVGACGTLIAATLRTLVHLGSTGRSARRLLLVAKLSIAWIGLAKTMRMWMVQYPQPKVVSNDDGAANLEAIDQLVRRTAAGSLVRVGCKERALTGLALARAAGYPADLVIGMTYLPLAGHVWVEVGDRIITDEPEHCRPYQVVARYT